MNNTFIKKTLCAVALGTLVFGITQPIYATEVSPEVSSTEAVSDDKTQEAPSWDGNVLLVNQYDETKNQFTFEENKKFLNGTDKIGTARIHEGLFNKLKTNFICWATKPQLPNGDIPSDAKIFSAKDTVQTAFPQGLKGGEKLYAVYIGVVDATRPEYSEANGNDAVGLAGLVNSNNEVTINNKVKPEDVLPNTTNVSETIIPKKEIKNSIYTNEIRTVIDGYVAKNDVEDINELVLRANFKTDTRIALLVHDNPTFGYEGKRVLTENYKDIKDFSFAKGKAAGYTHVDLVVNIDERVTVPESMYLNIKGYAWRPLYIMNSDRTKALEIVDPYSNKNLGNTKDSFNSLIKNDTPDVTFKVLNPEHLKSLVIRLVLRDGNERIENIVADSEMTIAEKIAQNMELSSLSVKEIVEKFKLKKTEANKNVVKISDRVAKELSVTKGKDTVKISGYIEGVARASIGIIFGANTESFTDITRSESNVLNIGYTSDIEEESSTPIAKPIEVKLVKKPVLANTGITVTGIAIVIITLAILGIVMIRKSQK